jgi:hypothetical protein
VDVDSSELGACSASMDAVAGVSDVELGAFAEESVSLFVCLLTEVVNCRGLMGRLDWKLRGDRHWLLLTAKRRLWTAVAIIKIYMASIMYSRRQESS